jgi:DNA-binding SARP family transcriptional activator
VGLGETLEEPAQRLHVLGELMVEGCGALVRERHLPSRQGRLAFTYLVLNMERPVPLAELADVLWDEEPPREWELALSSIVSKLRTVLARTGLDRRTVIAGVFGCYQLRLPTRAWIDVAAAREAVHNAEGVLKRDDAPAAYGDALLANILLRRPFLAGESGRWVEQTRTDLHADRMRALRCLVQCLASNGETELAIKRANELVDHEPYGESGYLLLMRLYADAGMPAEALRVYERCRQMLREELAISPSAELRELHRSLVSEGAPALRAD